MQQRKIKNMENKKKKPQEIMVDGRREITTRVCEREYSAHREYLKKYSLRKYSTFGKTCESSDKNHKSKVKSTTRNLNSTVNSQNAKDKQCHIKPSRNKDS